MNYLDTDTTETDWSEFGHQEQSGRCPITGVSLAPVYAPDGLADDERAGGRAASRGCSKSKLQAMFDKFLYQK